MATLSVLLTKLTNVFKTDSHIFDGMYVLGGPESCEKNTATNLITLRPGYVNVIQEEFPEKEFINIPNIREVKKDKSLITFDTPINAELIRAKKNQILKKREAIDTWHEMNLSEADLKSLFDDKTIIDLDVNGVKVPLSKRSIPMFTEKTAKDITYGIDTSNPNIYDFVYVMTTEWFDIIGVMRVITITEA